MQPTPVKTGPAAGLSAPFSRFMHDRLRKAPADLEKQFVRLGLEPNRPETFAQFLTWLALGKPARGDLSYSRWPEPVRPHLPKPVKKQAYLRGEDFAVWQGYVRKDFEMQTSADRAAADEPDDLRRRRWRQDRVCWYDYLTWLLTRPSLDPASAKKRQREQGEPLQPPPTKRQEQQTETHAQNPAGARVPAPELPEGDSDDERDRSELVEAMKARAAKRAADVGPACTVGNKKHKAHDDGGAGTTRGNDPVQAQRATSDSGVLPDGAAPQSPPNPTKPVGLGPRPQWRQPTVDDPHEVAYRLLYVCDAITGMARDAMKTLRFVREMTGLSFNREREADFPKPWAVKDQLCAWRGKFQAALRQSSSVGAAYSALQAIVGGDYTPPGPVDIRSLALPSLDPPNPHVLVHRVVRPELVWPVDNPMWLLAQRQEVTVTRTVRRTETKTASVQTVVEEVYGRPRGQRTLYETCDGAVQPYFDWDFLLLARDLPSDVSPDELMVEACLMLREAARVVYGPDCVPLVSASPGRLAACPSKVPEALVKLSAHVVVRNTPPASGGTKA